ncbi:MAG: hypothetical protein FJY82_08630 [Candidatus Aminicenantes bacterium]|nr:hypothetical protein [Candidatus Aminicenantes bacterium]
MNTAPVIISCMLLLAGIVDAQQTDFPTLTGPYLGQKPPGKTPEIFAPGIISTSNSEHGTVTFSPKGDEVFWATIYANPFRKKILYSRVVDSVWTIPQIASFSHGDNEGNPTFSPDGTKLFFASWKSLTDNEKPKHHIMYSRKTENGWSEPELVDDIINSISRYWQVSVSLNGNIYFEVEFDGPEIYCSEYKNNKYQKPYKIDLGFPAGMPYISSDESYIIFSAANRPEGYGEHDLYISYKKENGKWTKGKNLGEKINSKEIDVWPIVSPDWKYLFFTSRRDGKQDIYWVNTSFIEELRPKE